MDSFDFVDGYVLVVPLESTVLHAYACLSASLSVYLFHSTVLVVPRCAHKHLYHHESHLPHPSQHHNDLLSLCVCVCVYRDELDALYEAEVKDVQEMPHDKESIQDTATLMETVRSEQNTSRDKGMCSHKPLAHLSFPSFSSPFHSLCPYASLSPIRALTYPHLPLYTRNILVILFSPSIPRRCSSKEKRCGHTHCSTR